jgi:hypothetical protein
VRELGRKESATRTATETEIAAFWGTSPELPWFAALEHVVNTANTSTGTGLGVVEATRAYALASLAFADSRIAALDNKYFYSMWRPETSLAEGNGVGFPKDPDYRSFLTTPNTPEVRRGGAKREGGGGGKGGKGSGGPVFMKGGREGGRGGVNIVLQGRVLFCPLFLI